MGVLSELIQEQISLWQNQMLRQRLVEALWETSYMVAIAAAIAVIVGVPLGILLVTTEKRNILSQPLVNKILSSVINVGRSIPFIILMVAIIPFTRLIVGTSIGTLAAIVPLTVAAIPFMARVVETAVREVDRGVVEAAQSMGASPWQIIVKVLLPESRPGLVLGVTITAVSLIGYSAMAGAIGGGGLGNLAIVYGYQRFRRDIMIATVLILVVMVQGIQVLGNWLATRLDKK